MARDTAVLVGLGSIGRRHLANLRALEPEMRIVVQRRTPDPASTDAHLQVATLDAALAERPKFAIVCTPAPAHVGTALAFARAGAHVLVEKPISDRLDGVDELIGTCASRGVVLMVGYTLRFNAQLARVREALISGRIGRLLSIRAEVGQYLPDWRPGTDYRTGTTARRELGGGVLLELSHEIDYVRWLGGEVESVAANAARIGDLDIDVDDYADILVRFTSGAAGSIHLDLLQRPAVRRCRVTGTAGTIEWDAIAGTASIYSAADAAWTPLGTSVADRNEMYVNELRAFFAAARGAVAPPVTGADGRRVLEIALAAQRASGEGRWVTV